MGIEGSCPAGNDAHGVSSGKTLPAYPTDVKNVYPKEAFTAENAAKIPCEQVLGRMGLCLRDRKNEKIPPEATDGIFLRFYAIQLITTAARSPDRAITTFWQTQRDFIVVLMSYPINSLNTQVKLLLTWEPSADPALMERNASSGVRSPASHNGTESPAARRPATLAEPCANFENPVMRNGIRITGIGEDTRRFARVSPTPVALTILASAPPLAVINTIGPATFRASDFFR